MGQARELMDRGTRAGISGDLDVLREIYDPNVEVSTPDSGTLRGVEAFIEWNRGFIDAFSDRDYRAERSLETEDCAIDQGEFIGTHTQPLALPDGTSVPPTGKQVRMRAVDIVTVSDGKIVKHDFYFDQLQLLDQLGLSQGGAPTT
jgi:ketosteroid isomerase-like protein